MTTTEKVWKMLQAARKPLRSHEIAERTGANWNTVRGILVRLNKEGAVSKEGRGLYKYSSYQRFVDKKTS